MATGDLGAMRWREDGEILSCELRHSFSGGVVKKG